MIHERKTDETTRHAIARAAARPDAKVSGRQMTSAVVVTAFLTYYLALNGDRAESVLAPLVHALTQATQSADALLYAIGGIGLVYVVVLAALLFRKPDA